MNTTSWGRYPVIEAETLSCVSDDQFRQAVQSSDGFIPRGNGRSYGDSALSPKLISALPAQRFLAWDNSTGVLECEAGVLLADILASFVPRGWFLPTTPGTKWISIGGAIACDVHGKNHHSFGCFSDAVLDFRLMLPDGSILNVSRTENPEWFVTTCGGMGLTGVILSARITLKRIASSYMDQVTTKTANLKETFAAFERHQHDPYSVAWIDCLATGSKVGRCLLMTGDHAQSGSLDFNNKMLATVPDMFPSFTLNSLSMQAFNTLYYGKAPKGESKQKIGINSFFYPLDIISEWNRIYGRQGFLQYQFVLPFASSYEGLNKILGEIGKSGRGSFLAVLKLFGKANSNYLSFPEEGYTLALDFKRDAGLFPLLDRLDAMVLDYGGRFYLTKDARVSKATFEKGYPHIDEFRAWREKQGLTNKIWSLQSRRLGL